MLAANASGAILVAGILLSIEVDNGLRHFAVALLLGAAGLFAASWWRKHHDLDS